MSDLLSIVQAADLLKRTPREISDLFYRRLVPVDAYPMIGARRVIPRSRLSELRKALDGKGPYKKTAG